MYLRERRLIVDALQDTPKNFTFANVMEERVFRDLFEIGPAPAGFYRDACYLMSLRGPLPTSTTHLVAHLLREVNGALIDVIAPLGESVIGEEDPNLGDLTKLRAALSFLGIANSDDLAKKWRQLLKGDNCFKGFAHRCDLTGPRIRTESFDRWFSEVTIVFSVILDRYRTRFLRVTDYIDSIVNLNEPPKDIRRRIPAAKLTYGYFFSNLTNPRWLPSLKKKGFFSMPGSGGANASACGAVNMWPQAQYLKRMAAIDDRKVQQQVLDIMLEVGATNNRFIHADFTEAAVAMPGDMASQWAMHETEWLRGGYPIRGFLEENLGRLIAKLAKSKQSNVAVKLAAELLAVLPDPEATKKLGETNEIVRMAQSSLEATTRCDRYSYEQVLKKNIPDLVANAPFEALELLCSLLGNAVKFSRAGRDENKPNDVTFIWRPAIEDHQQNRDYTIDCPLITAVRDAAEGICRQNPDKIAEVVSLIEGHGWNVFRRISMYLLRVVENPPMGLVRDRLINEDLFNASGVYHEYFHLLKKWFPSLAPEEQQQILIWIDEAAKEKESLAAHGQELSPEQKDQRLKYWKYRRLNPIQEYLTGERKVWFEARKAEQASETMPADFNTYSGAVWSGVENPHKSDKLARMSIDELIVYLKTWKPTGEWRAPTPDSLGSALGVVVAENPERFAVAIEQFMAAGLEPIYIRHIVSAFVRAMEAGKPVPLDKIFRLCGWIIRQNDDIPRRDIPEGLRDSFDVDKNWRNARSEVVRFVEKALNQETKLPLTFRKRVWSVIEPLTNDLEPDVEYEREHSNDDVDSVTLSPNCDPLSLSLNTVRGKALHAVMEYIMWVYRNYNVGATAEDRRILDRGEVPEALAVLERHLDVNLDRTQTSRAVYGQWLAQLTYLGPNWVMDNFAKLFPREQELKPLRNAVWHTYLQYGGQLYPFVAETLQGLYRGEVLALEGRKLDGDAYKLPEMRIAEHVALLFMWGKIGLEPDSLIDVLFRVAPHQVATHVMEYLGRCIYEANELTPEVAEKLKNLRDWRLRQIGGTDNLAKDELAAFGWWFATAQLDAPWALSHLEETLKLTEIKASNLQVMERLAGLFASYPSESLRCLRLFIDRNSDPWFFLSDRKQKGVWTILELGMVAADAAIRNQAEEIVHLLGFKGYLEYRELLRKVAAV